jgi:ABC-type lipoprotein release transport system permease subunit
MMSRLIEALLFDLTSRDPVTLAVTTFTLGAAALLAGYVPARRASRIDPVVTLRAD